MPPRKSNSTAVAPPPPRAKKRPIEQYAHDDKQRVNNPEVGLVTPHTDPLAPTRKTYEYDPHLDPQLVWAGKKEHTSFEVPTVSLHVHERIDPRTIIEAVRNFVPPASSRPGSGSAASSRQPFQPSLFERPEENKPLREAIDFYRHAHGWSNRLIAGDSLLVMNSLLEKEGMAGKLQMVYIDPPYGIKYGSNFQPFVNKRDVKDGKDEDLTEEPEMVRAFRDTWELGIHSYLTYLRDRLLLARELLHDSGSLFVQISDENLHLIRNLLDDIFGDANHIATICYKKPGQRSSATLDVLTDFVIWYAKDKERIKFRRLFVGKTLADEAGDHYGQVELPDGTVRPLKVSERLEPSTLPKGARVFETTSLTSAGAQTGDAKFRFNGAVYEPPPHKHWSASIEGMKRLADAGRVIPTPTTVRYKRYFDDFSYVNLDNRWNDVGLYGEFIYVVQTAPQTIERCVLMTTDPGDLVFDPTCGSGTTAYVAEQWGRRWITCDTSRVAITLAKQRLMSAVFDYYELAHPDEGVGSGFRYKTVPHVTLKSIANNPEIRAGMTREQIDNAIARYADQETLYDQPRIDKSKARVSGPFTVEAVPAPTVRSLEDFVPPASSRLLPLGTADALPTASEQDVGRMPESKPGRQDAGVTKADASVARSGPSLRHDEWRDELLQTGIRGRAGQMIHFSRVEPLGGTRWLHADAETKGDPAAKRGPERVVISFGPIHGPLEQRQVELAWEEARTLSPKPAIIVFAAFEFDPEAAKDIDELTKEKTGITFLKAKMNGDLLTEDLKKKRSSNQSFWLVGSPDVEARQIKKGEHKDKWQVEVLGFDYFNTRTGTIESGDTSKIAMWLLDTDYDGRSLYPRQVFFPMAGETEGWAKLARNLKAEIDPERIEAYRGALSLPFASGKHKRAAVKVIDDRGIESLKVLPIS